MLKPADLLNALRRRSSEALAPLSRSTYAVLGQQQDKPQVITSPPAQNPAQAHIFTGSSRPLSSLQIQILERVEACYQEAEISLKRAFPRPITQFTLRGKSAGTAHLQQNRLRFNPVLLRENSEAFLTEVVPHEICHLLCFQLFGKTKPHGKEWQSLMLTVFKVNPNTTHSFNTASVASKDVEYHCACGPIRLSIRRHNKVLRGESRYICKRCKTHLTAI
ncbi:SprT family zinc-dependent metalloprotease [Shewanella profunda]|uniref:SprT family zinc-dependent metalloprotease n=1 Tax=Shewanella profunda TaxID=254793 RepID=UPI00200D6309|nr:SprT family zinc-dependent metalloprotease [Shewanella profunda]MCL1091588.1 SprT family zinc-dependent metalloprotease [Shewanella profunda]